MASRELAHPEPGFTIVGSKSYGRAPTFLMATGYEQVRSVVADIAGDHEAARDVRLVLPETGVCNSDPLPQAGGFRLLRRPRAGRRRRLLRQGCGCQGRRRVRLRLRLDRGDRTGEQVVLLRSRRMRSGVTGGTARHGEGDMPHALA